MFLCAPSRSSPSIMASSPRAKNMLSLVRTSVMSDLPVAESTTPERASRASAFLRRYSHSPGRMLQRGGS